MLSNWSTEVARMWVSQTYLGNIGQGADVYIYYFWEDYARQPKFDDSVLKNLADLGYSFREKVSVFVPQSSYLGLIREEMKTKFDKFWRTFSGKTPGLFLITKPLSDFDPVSGDWLFLPIPSQLVADDALLTTFFRELHSKCEEIISFNHRQLASTSNKSTSTGILKILYDSLQLKPSFIGFGVDLKPLLSSLQRRVR